MRDQLPVESLVDALQDSVHKECGGVRAVSGRPPCNPMTTQCPRCNNSVAECDSGRDTDLDLDDVAATSQKAKAELEELRAENERFKEQLKACATVCTEELVRGRLIGVPQKLSFAGDRGMKNLDEVTEWMITTRGNFEALAREFSAMNVKTGGQHDKD